MEFSNFYVILARKWYFSKSFNEVLKGIPAVSTTAKFIQIFVPWTFVAVIFLTHLLYKSLFLY